MKECNIVSILIQGRVQEAEYFRRYGRLLVDDIVHSRANNNVRWLHRQSSDEMTTCDLGVVSGYVQYLPRRNQRRNSTEYFKHLLVFIYFLTPLGAFDFLQKSGHGCRQKPAKVPTPPCGHFLATSQLPLHPQRSDWPERRQETISQRTRSRIFSVLRQHSLELC